jgi:resuscitation-promoting factor RpfB
MSLIRTARPKSVTFITTVIARMALAGAVVATSLAPARVQAATAPDRPAAHVRLASALMPDHATAASAARARSIARRMLRSFDWTRRQFTYLNQLWERESGWNVFAENRYSGAYGIPQALPPTKMAAAGGNWRTSARTQIRWGLGYIKGTYGSPRRAWGHELATGWY